MKRLNRLSKIKCEDYVFSLKLSESDHLLEIGTGWGGLAVFAAKNYGCNVTTTTISQEQYDFAKQKVASEGLTGQINVVFKDYRDLKGQFDKLVSVEMIEAVGENYLDEYFRSCRRLLKPGGLFALQAITIPDDRYDYYRSKVDFIQKYIFPGGFLPSMASLKKIMSNETDFVVSRVFDIGLDYAETLSWWHNRFEGNLETIRKLGYAEEFIRMWRFYLNYCEAGFREQTINAVQVIASRQRSS